MSERKYSRMYAECCIEDYVQPGPELEPLMACCRASEFQFLDHAPLECSLSDSGGVEFPDFLLYGDCVPLVSEKFRQLLDGLGVDNLYYKKIILAAPELGLKEYYWLALPPRIDCLDREESEIEVQSSRYRPPEEWRRYAERIVINPAMVGNYKIFKLPQGFDNDDIIVTGEVRDAVLSRQLKNVYFSEVEES